MESRLKGSRSLFDSYIHYGISKEDFVHEYIGVAKTKTKIEVVL